MTDEQAPDEERVPGALLKATAAEVRDLLAVVLEMIEPPHAVTMAGDKVRAETLTRRAIAVAVALRDLVDPGPHWAAVPTSTMALRAALQRLPAEGYVTEALYNERRDAGMSYMDAVREDITTPAGIAQ